MKTDSTSDVRSGRSRVLRPATALLALILVGLTAAPASAVPEGFSDPDPVSPGQALLVYLVAPLAVAALITLLVMLPFLITSAKAAPGMTDVGAEGETGHAELEGAASEEVGLDTLLGADSAEETAASE